MARYLPVAEAAVSSEAMAKVGLVMPCLCMFVECSVGECLNLLDSVGAQEGADDWVCYECDWFRETGQIDLRNVT